MAAFVLGNGVSRQYVDVNQLMEQGTVYGCNGLYRTHTPHVLVATDHPIANAIQRSGYSNKNRFYTRRPAPNLGALEVPKQYFGYSSGPIALSLAALDGHKTIFLIGFDMGPDQQGKFNNVFAGTEFYKGVGAAPTFTGNWAKQMCRVISDFADRSFVRVMGETTHDLPEFRTHENFKSLPLTEFISKINTLKDL